jgi:hypothetical protein
MMSLAQIRSESDRATRRARGKGVKPYLLTEATLRGIIEEGRAFPFPFIGSYVPKNFTKMSEFFVDSSGFGGPSEPALTKGQFIKQLTIGRYYAITEVGPFQCYVGEYVYDVFYKEGE